MQAKERLAMEYVQDNYDRWVLYEQEEERRRLLEKCDYGNNAFENAERENLKDE